MSRYDQILEGGGVPEPPEPYIEDEFGELKPNPKYPWPRKMSIMDRMVQAAREEIQAIEDVRVFRALERCGAISEEPVRGPSRYAILAADDVTPIEP